MPRRRTLIIVRALTCFYIAIGSFAAASLISLLGAVFVAAHQDLLRQVTLTVSLCAGVIGVGGLTCGSGLLVFETRMALRGMAEETRFLLSKHKHKPSSNKMPRKAKKTQRKTIEVAEATEYFYLR